MPLFYVRGGGMMMRAAVSNKEDGNALLFVDSSAFYPLALDDADAQALRRGPRRRSGPSRARPRAGSSGCCPYFKLGTLDLPQVPAMQGAPLGEYKNNFDVDLQGVVGAGLLSAFRVTFGDDGRWLWLEVDPSLMGGPQGAAERRRPAAASAAGRTATPPSGPARRTAEARAAGRRSPRRRPPDGAPRRPADRPRAARREDERAEDGEQGSREMSRALAVYAGSFDPATLGHLDLIERAAALFDNVIVAIGVHPTKHPLFSAEERKDLIVSIASHIPNVVVDSFDGLLIEYCASKNASVIVRGLRVTTDFEYELQIAHANADLRPQIDTIFLPTRTKHGFVSASLVREIASHGGDVSRYAPAVVCEALSKKFAKKP